MARIAKNELLDAMEARYDYYSARAVLGNALGEAGLPDRGDYSPEEVAAFCQALRKVGERVERVVSLLEANLPAGVTPAAPARAEAKPEPQREAAPAEHQERPAEHREARAKAKEAPAEPARHEEPPAEAARPEAPALEPEAKAEKRTEADRATHAEPPAPEKKPAAAGVSIVMRGEGIGPGHTVFVGGGIPELGNWEAERGLALEPAAGADWSARLDLAPGTSFEFKFFRRDPEGHVQWESGDNRSFTVPPDGAGEYVATWQ